MTNVAQRIANLSPEKRALLEEKMAELSLATSSLVPLEHSSTGNSQASFGQERLWLLEQFENGAALYNICLALHLKGVLNTSALKRALCALVKRHETLRTRYTDVSGRLRLEILEEAEVPLPVTDFSGVDQGRREELLSVTLHAEASRPILLDREPAIRVALYRMGDCEHVLQLVLHHVASDGWSMGVLFRDLAAFYNAEVMDAAVELPNLPVTFSDYARWQREQLAGPQGERLISYWKDQLEGSSFALRLPTDRPRPALQTFHGALRRYSLSTELAKAIQQFCIRESVTPFMLTLAALYAVLARYTGQNNILIGTPIAARSRLEVEDLIGFFTNTVIMRGNLECDPTFRELLQRVRQTSLEAYAHQDLPLEMLIDAISPKRDLSRSALFQVMLVFQTAPAPGVALYGLETSVRKVRTDTAKFDFTIELTPVGEAIEGAIEYNTDLFDSGTIDRLWGHLTTCLQRAVAAPDEKVATIPLLTPAERQQQLVEWNSTAVSYPRNIGLHELIEAQVERTPESEALRFRDNSITYRELNARANQLAHYLRKRGVRRNILVAVCADRSIEMVVALLACLKAGGAYLPLDPEYPAERLRAILEEANPPVVLTQSHLQSRVLATKADSFCLDSQWQELACESTSNLAAGVGGKDLAYAIFTSGSTGKPKGVLNVHEGIVNRLLWMQDAYVLQPSDRVLQKTSFSFDVSVWEFFWPLLTGATLVIAEPDGHRDPSYLVRLIQQERITTMHFVPSMLRTFLETEGVENCTSLKKVFCGGEALPYEVQERFFERQEAELHNLYGPTEAAVDVTFWACQRNGRNQTVPIGRPIANTQIVILDSSRQPVPVGVAGELHIGGVNLARGYLCRPDLTAEKFVPNPFPELDTDRLYRTGDLARFLPDGNVEFLGRLDQQVKIRGYRIELGEIEAVLRQQPDVHEAVVVADEKDGDKRLVAYIVAAADISAPAASEIRTRLKQRLPDYMLPASYVFLEQLPLSPNGKIDRKALPAPDIDSYSIRGYESPQGEIETKLAAIWAEVLKLDRIGRHDDFFELGGHSLMAVQVIAKIRAALPESQPSLAALLKAPTVEQFAHSLKVGQAEWSYLVPMREGGKRPPFFCVHGAGGNVLDIRGLAMAMPPDQPFYCLQARGLDGHSAPFSSVEEAAECYAEQIRKVQPHGPYFLGGRSYGGIVAFEMARRLRSMGETVGVTALIDTRNFAYGSFLSKPALLYFNARYFLRRTLHHIRILGRMKPQDWSSYLLARAVVFLRLAANVARIVGGRKGTMFPNAVLHEEARITEDHRELEKVLRRVRIANLATIREFIPKPYNGYLLVIRASVKSDEDPYNDEALGWRPVALGGLTICEIEGDHHSILEPPMVAELAEVLDKTIREAQQRTE